MVVVWIQRLENVGVAKKSSENITENILHINQILLFKLRSLKVGYGEVKRKFF